MTSDNFDVLLDLAIAEDFGAVGDVTTDAVFRNERAKATLFSKDSGILCGIEYFGRVFKRIDPEISVNPLKTDGEMLEPGMSIARIEGRTASILKAERISLNFLSFLTGIATSTHRFVLQAFQSGNTVILDTRKTLPGYRELSKFAVRTGGGKNHRMGLYDMVMIKDNHIDCAGSIAEAVRRVREKWDTRFRMEVECRTLGDVREAIGCGVDIIMLDNMDVDLTREAIAIPHRGITYEASGNMTLDRVREYSELGVDYLSVGALTHSVKAFDFSLGIPR